VKTGRGHRQGYLGRRGWAAAAAAALALVACLAPSAGAAKSVRTSVTVAVQGLEGASGQVSSPRSVCRSRAVKLSAVKADGTSVPLGSVKTGDKGNWTFSSVLPESAVIKAEVARKRAKVPSKRGKRATVAGKRGKPMKTIKCAGASSQAEAKAPLALATEDTTLRGGGQREDVRLGVTAATDGPGLARIGMPAAANGTVLGDGDGLAQPQISDPTKSGFVGLENRSCASASLVSVTPTELPPSSVTGSVEIAYDCKPGEQFIVHYYARTDWTSQVAGADGYNRWPFDLSWRSSQAKPWIPLSGAPQIRIGAFVVVDVNQVFIMGPPILMDASEDSDDIILTLQGRVPDGSKVEVTMNTEVFYLSTGQEMVLSDPAQLPGLVGPSQPPVTVSDCAAGMCVGGGGGFAEVQLVAPPGIFVYGSGPSAGNPYQGAILLQSIGAVAIGYLNDHTFPPLSGQGYPNCPAPPAECPIVPPQA
jgi:hypothetical protein